jgi:ComF family protein
VTRSSLAFVAWLIDLLLPRRCVACGAAAELLCPSCLLELRPLGRPCCDCCGAPTAWSVARCRECSGRRFPFATARAAVAYAGPARALVRAWKERGLRHVAALAAEFVVAHVERPAADVITYIPPDAVRQLQRGHHPAERLAAELSSRWEIAAAPLLARQATIARQTGLGLAARRRNVRGAFKAGAGCPARVVLVDDVYTTGATVAAAAGALRAAGAGAVEVVTFARVVR